MKIDIKCMLICAIAAWGCSSVVWSQGNPEAKFPVDLKNESLGDIAIIYKLLTGRTVDVEVEDPFKVNLKTAKDVNQSEYFWMLEELFRLNGILIIEEGNDPVGPIKFVRANGGEYFDSVDDSVESRLEKTLSGIRANNGNVSSLEFKNENAMQVLRLAQSFSGKTILRGPGLPENARISYDDFEGGTKLDAFLTLEALLREKGIILVDTGDQCIAAIAVE